MCAKWIAFLLPIHPRYVDVSLTITPRSGVVLFELRNLPGSPDLRFARVTVALIGRRSRVRTQDCSLDRAMKSPQRLKCPGSSSRSRMSGVVSWVRSSVSGAFGGFQMVWTHSRAQRRGPFGATTDRVGRASASRRDQQNRHRWRPSQMPNISRVCWGQRLAPVGPAVIQDKPSSQQNYRITTHNGHIGKGTGHGSSVAARFDALSSKQ